MARCSVIGYFSVKNWEEYQHYKDRDPEWIKLYARLLENYDFSLLPDPSKWHLVGIFLLASRYKNKIPLDPQWVAKRISAFGPVDLSLLKNAGFIDFDHDCSETLAERYQSAIPEKETQVETEIEKDLLPPRGGVSKPKGYPEDFEVFWKAYPTDPNMSKKEAAKQWAKLTPEKRQRAIASLPAFKIYCDKNHDWYRVIYAERYLSEEKFDGHLDTGQVIRPSAFNSPEELAAQQRWKEKFGG